MEDTLLIHDFLFIKAVDSMDPIFPFTGDKVRLPRALAGRDVIVFKEPANPREDHIKLV